MRLAPSMLLFALAACGGSKDDVTPATGSGSPSGSTTTGSTTSSGSTTTGTPTFPIPDGWIRVDVDRGALEASVDAAIGDDGTIYVTWSDDNGSDPDVRISRSVDGGATWSAPVTVDGPGHEPLVAAGRQAYVHAGPNAIWVVFTQDATVRLFRSDLDPLAFTEVPIDEGAVTFVDYAKVATDAGGQAWVTWLSYDGPLIWPTVAREANGFAVAEAGNFSDDPCECCRNDLFFTAVGSGILSFRGNDGTNRDIWSLRAGPSDADFTSVVQVGHTGWQSQVCPMQGPRMAQLGDGTLLSTWTDPTAGPWSAWVARSTDDGQSWSGDTRVATFLAGDQRDPDIAADGQDAWLTLKAEFTYYLLESSDGGATFSQLEVLDSGATNIVEPQVEARGGIALVAGANASGEVVVQRLK